MGKQLTDDDLANMSDDEILNLDLSSIDLKSAANTDPVVTEQEEVELTDKEAEEYGGQSTNNADSDKEDEDAGETDEKKEPSDDPQADQSGNAEANPAGNADADSKTAADPSSEDGEGKSADGKPTGTAPATPADGDLKSFHAKITAPFKANGREMQVASADEAIQLMQMGANYNKKMAALRPNLNLMKMLEKAGLLSEERINFLIDVASKKPDAISKLVQEAGIDPLEISAEKAGGYTPGNHRITPQEQALDEVFESLEGQEGFDRTLDVIGKQWDDASRGLIAQNPKALRDITQHIQAGWFDKVMAKVDRERTFGNLTGLSDVEAYRQVGIAMMTSGELAPPAGQATQQGQPVAPAKVVVTLDPKKADEDDRRKKRQAASPTRATAPSSKIPADFNPLAMSDEEIAKLDLSKFK